MIVSTDSIRSTLFPYIEGLTPEHLLKISIYMDLLNKWNRKISLTSISNAEEILRFHFGESLYVLDNLEIMNGRLADVGSGAGFPALAIKILRPELSITLLEPNRKKCAFLAEVSRGLGFRSVEIVSARFEDYRESDAAFDFVTSRALGKTDKLLKWSRHVLRPSGLVILWISSEAGEKLAKMPGWNWNPSLHIPQTTDRSILLGENAS